MPMFAKIVDKRAAKKRKSERTQRIVALQVELDVHGVRSAERTRTIETKAAYATTAAAVVVVASISLLSPALKDIPAVLPLVFAVVAIVFSTRAIRPLSLGVVSARQLVNRYVEADMPLAELEDHLLEVRTREIEQRDTLNVKRAWAMVWGFKFLTGSVVALLLASIYSGVLPIETDNNDQTRIPQSTNSPRTP